MEISKSLEHSATEAIVEAGALSAEQSQELIPVKDTPFFLSSTGEGILVHGIVEHEGSRYYIGTLEQQA